MLNVIDVANFFIYLNKKEYRSSLTKDNIFFLCYLAQGWYYSKNDEILFDENLCVTNNNLFIKEIDNKIIDNKKIITDYIDNFDISIFHSKEIELLIAIYDYYSQFSINYLYRILFHNNSPWKKAIENNCTIIDKNNLKVFFKNRKYFDDIH